MLHSSTHMVCSHICLFTNTLVMLTNTCYTRQHMLCSPTHVILINTCYTHQHMLYSPTQSCYAHQHMWYSPTHAILTNTYVILTNTYAMLTNTYVILTYTCYTHQLIPVCNTHQCIYLLFFHSRHNISVLFHHWNIRHMCFYHTLKNAKQLYTTGYIYIYIYHINRRRTDNTIVKRNRTKGQTIIYKKLHRNKIYLHEDH